VPTLWMNLGIIVIIFSAILYFYQEVIKNASWSWRQVFSMETAVCIALFIGVTLLLVSFVERKREKKKKE